MRRAGYTLVEVMAAILIIGIAFTALVQGLGTIRRMQAATAERMADGRTAGRIAAAVSRFLAQPGLPALALPDRLTGDARSLEVLCSAPPCTLEIQPGKTASVLISRVRGVESRQPMTGLVLPALRYVTTTGVYDRWPLAGGYQTRLIAIAVIDQPEGRASPVATVRLWSEQPQDCSFDSIAAKCRSPHP